jgi:uncharacterized protein (TIGR00661 family)
MLRSEHRFVIFAPGDAYDLLAPAYAGSDVRVVRIPGLHFSYTSDNTVSKRRTAITAARYAGRLPSYVRRLAAEIQREAPALAITDFEPSLARAASLCGLPYVSLDHQHFLTTSDFSQVPARLKRQAAFMAFIVDMYYRRQAKTIVSSFCFPPLRRDCGDVVQIGPLLRPNVLAAKPEHGSYLLVYLRKFGSPAILDALAACGRDVLVYGLGELPPRGRVCFLPIDEGRFVDDLAGAAALVTTAGNQLLGEALYLGKPVFAMPEPKNAEQELHGHLLAAEGTGEWHPFDRVDAPAIGRFLERADGYRARIDRERLNGNAAALRELRPFLPQRDATLQAVAR